MTLDTTAKKFVPEDHLRCLKCGKMVSACPCGPFQRPYLETKWRLVWLREKYEPDGISLESEIVAWEPAIVVKTTATFPHGEARLTAFGSATPEKGKVYSGREVEKAETAAIGRLCAMLGFGTQFTEEDDTDHLADSPGEAKPGRAGTQGAQGSAPRPLEPANPASKPQRDSIARMLHQLLDQDAMEFCEDYGIGIQMKTDGQHYGVGIEAAGLTGGTHGTASQLIDELLPLVKKVAKGAPPPTGGTVAPSAPVETATPAPPVPVVATPKPRSKADADAFMGRISAMLPEFGLTVFDVCEWLQCQPTQVVAKVTEWVKAKEGRTVTVLMQQIQADKGAVPAEPEQAALMEGE